MLINEPYATFIKKFDKLNGAIANEKIHLRISSDKKNGDEAINKGFSLDRCYTKRFDLDFRYISLIDDEKTRNEKFCILHTISYMYDDIYCEDMMTYTIDDIKKRNGYFYISSDVKECEVDCHINGHNVVAVDFFVCCEKDKAREVSLQLISQDIALFARSF